MKAHRLFYLSLLTLFGTVSTWAIDSAKVDADLGTPDALADYWQKATPATVTLMAQPMITPRPATTTTANVEVRSVHNGATFSVRISWDDKDINKGIGLAQYSDAVAMQIPMKQDGPPPPVFMGMTGNPVYIYHWRYQYQLDVEQGKPTIQMIYPNAKIDIYPLDIPDWGNLKPADQEAKDNYNPAVAVGNPQSYPKTGIDEIIAEGYQTSSVTAGKSTHGHGVWKDGKWHVVLSRPFKAESGPAIDPAKDLNLAFAVWKGNEGEVGSRKSVTMMWTPLKFK